MTTDTTKPDKILTGKQQGAALLLCAGLSVQEVSVKVRTSKRTLRGWLRQPLFVEQLRSLQSGMFQATSAALYTVGQHATATLLEIITDSSQTAAARSQASISVLKVLTKHQSDTELSRRLTALEDKLKRADK